MKTALLAALALLAAPALAQEARHDPWELRLEGQRDRLSRDLPDWSEALLQLAWRPTNRQAVFGGYRETERFDLRDREGFAGAYIPLPGVRSSIHAEFAASSTHRVLAKRTSLLEFVQPLEHGWVLSAGGRHQDFSVSKARAAWVTVERYVGDWRLAYRYTASGPQGQGWAPSHRATASWYRGELTFVTLDLARGREVEFIPPALVQSRVKAASLAAGVEVAPRWGLSLELGWVEQGDLYTRRFARIGARHLF